VRRALQKTMRLQTASTTDDGLQHKRVWIDSGNVTLTLLPASKTDVELAGLRGERVTHSALVPTGVAITTNAHRFMDGATVYRIASAVYAPRGLSCVLEATS
jgi:hypothetical protein